MKLNFNINILKISYSYLNWKIKSKRLQRFYNRVQRLIETIKRLINIVTLIIIK